MYIARYMVTYIVLIVIIYIIHSFVYNISYIYNNFLLMNRHFIQIIARLTKRD